MSLGMTAGTLTFDFKNQTGESYPEKVRPGILSVTCVPVNGFP